MGFPDRIERSISVAHPPAKVWEAITTAEGLGTWFGHQATVDLRVGGLAQLTFEGGHSADLRIERLEPPHVFGYTWGISGLPADDPRLDRLVEVPRHLQPVRPLQEFLRALFERSFIALVVQSCVVYLFHNYPHSIIFPKRVFVSSSD